MKLFTRGFRKQRLLTILLAFCSLAFAILLCEVVLRLAVPSLTTKGYCLWPPHLKTVLKPENDLMPGVFGEADFVINSDGIRGDELEPSYTYRILALGGSTTECFYLDQGKTWPYLLQTTLNENTQNHKVWVGNAGKSGTTTRHHIMAMQYLRLKQMKINAIILLVGINDLSIRLSQDEHYDPNFLAKPEVRDRLLAEAFPGKYLVRTDLHFYKRTAVWQLLRQAREAVFRGDVKNVQDASGKIYITWREHRKSAAEIRDQLPDLSSALEEYARNINTIIDLAQENSVRLVCLTQPTMWRPDLPESLNTLLWMGGIGDFQGVSGRPYYSARALESGMDAYNNALLGICQERRIECFDLASMLRKDTTVFYDDAHFNDSGARQVAGILSEYMLKRDLFGGPHFTN